ncbi:hypothetical protein F4779DRAFT_616216 [Xylariaceae sp. FL0662B]|nr:hypothetical protein F4779DRAFT_616216 [Xylariaceae sp. FL0662B]
MNGAKDATDPSSAAPAVTQPTSLSTLPLMAGANGNGSNSSTAANPNLVNKRRKKDGLKPIITTEGPIPGQPHYPILRFAMRNRWHSLEYNATSESRVQQVIGHLSDQAIGQETECRASRHAMRVARVSHEKPRQSNREMASALIFDAAIRVTTVGLR